MRAAKAGSLVLLLAMACPPTVRAAHSPAAAPASAQAGATDGSLLVILTDTGERRDGMSVLQVHPGAPEVEAALRRGLSGTLLRVFAGVQEYLRAKEGALVEPAYVLLSNRQGGFAVDGFYLGDQDKSHASYVDVYREWPAAGRFGALDQIVPHELAHVLRRQLAGPLGESGANQVHALGVRTDPVVAFNEGFAEHLQAMAIEDPDADPATRALAHDEEQAARVAAQLRAYRNELGARFSPAGRMRMGFVLWYSNAEDVLRYRGVKVNAFAREPDLPARALTGGDTYRAYLLESVLPGAPDGAPRSVARMAATEGVVAALFYRWANHPGLRASRRDDAFYAQFGRSAGEVTPLENVYFKLFHVFWVAKPRDVLEVIAAYRDVFPDEAGLVDEVVADAFLGQAPEPAPELWLVSPTLTTGTTLFDQYRGLPRAHTFDLNAASIVDLLGVPGIDLELARAIQQGAPYATVQEVARVPGVPETIRARLGEMSLEMDRLRRALEDEIEQDLSLSDILTPFAWRAAAVVLLAAAAGALLFRSVRAWTSGSPPRWWRAALAGLGAALVGVPAGWALGAYGLGAVGAVALLFGIPAALRSLYRSRDPVAAALALAAWVAAAVPAALLTTPLG